MVTVLDGLITLDPAVRGGRPHISGSRLTVADIVVMHVRMGESLEELAGKYRVSLAQLHAAMSYYFDHRAEIDRHIEQDEAYAEAFFRGRPSVLQDKLKAIRGA